MTKSTTLIRVEKLLDIFHDGFHKLFGSPERRFNKKLYKSYKSSLFEREEIERKEANKQIAKAQELDIEGVALLKKIEASRTVKPSKDRLHLMEQEEVRQRLDELEAEEQQVSYDNDIEI